MNGTGRFRPTVVTIAAVLAVLVAGAVPAGAATTPQPATTLQPATAPQPALAAAAAASGGLPRVPKNSRQVISVSAAPGSTHARLSAWQRRADGKWWRFIGPIPARVGSRGIGPAREGSRYTPAGTMRLDQAFGRLVNPGTRLPYFRTDRRDWWDENPSSPTYNLHVRRSSSPGGASENLYTAGRAYDYAVNMAWNPDRVPGAGSAFFLHVTTGSATAGCVAIDASALRRILRWLRPGQHPVITTRLGAAWRPPVVTKIPSRLTQTTPAHTVTRPHTATLKGTLVSAARQRLGGMVVRVWARAHGGKNWARIGFAVTRPDGHYRFKFRPTGRKDYQVRWTGSSTWHGSVSRVILIRTR